MNCDYSAKGAMNKGLEKRLSMSEKVTLGIRVTLITPRIYTVTMYHHYCEKGHNPVFMTFTYA